MSKLHFSSFLLLLSWMLIAAGQVNAEDQASVPIAVLPDIKKDYEAFVGTRKLEEINTYSGAHARRDVIELVLLQQALKLGGFAEPIYFAEEQNYFRGLRNIIEGRTLTSGGTVWAEDIKDMERELYITSPLVKEGRFVVGLYTTPNNQRALSMHSLSELQTLRIVTSRQWKPDLLTLKTLGFNNVMYTPNWVNMARMLKAGRVDLTLAPFEQTNDMHIWVDGIELVPIQGVKVAIAGSRHWPVSRKHPQGEKFYRALVRGIEIMHSQGTIERAYRECGFFQSKSEDWKLLNPAP